MPQPLRILLVGGHPADAFDNAGGTLCRHAERGDEVTCLVMTQGARVHDVVISMEMQRRDRVPDADELKALMAERSKVKRQEVIDACAILGLTDVRFLEYDDAVLTVSEPLILAVARVIRAVRPHVVITHWPDERRAFADQHATTGRITMNAIAAAAGVYPGDPNPPHRVAQVFYQATPSCMARTSVLETSANYYADVIVDITGQIERKLRALDCLRSQAYNGAYARKRVEVCDGLFGFFAYGGHVAYAEGFIRMNAETLDYLPVTDRALRQTTLTEAEYMHEYCKLVTNEGD